MGGFSKADRHVDIVKVSGTAFAQAIETAIVGESRPTEMRIGIQGR